jgi:hypothetical protein
MKGNSILTSSLFASQERCNSFWSLRVEICNGCSGPDVDKKICHIICQIKAPIILQLMALAWKKFEHPVKRSSSTVHAVVIKNPKK